MNNKESAVVTLTLIVVVLVGVIVYLLFDRAYTPAYAQPNTAARVSTAKPPAKTSASSKNKRVTLDLSSDYARTYKTLLTRALKKTANFNEHYVVTDIGCGTACFYYAVIDKNTGKAYGTPVASDLGNFVGDIGEAFSLHGNWIKVITDNGSKVNTYAFNGSGFSLVSSQPTPAKAGVIP